MEKELDKQVYHDTRGRRIVSIDKAKRELISGYIIALIITSLIRVVVGHILVEGIDVSMYESINNTYIKLAILGGLLDAIMFLATWIVTYKFIMNKYAIRGVQKMAYKSIMVMINIVVCIYISVSMVVDTRDSIVEMEEKYNQYMSIFNIYSTYSDEYNNGIIKDYVDATLEDYKDLLYTGMFIKIVLAISGNFIGWSMVKRDVEIMGVAEDEYKMCLNIEDEYKPYTTNVKPENEVEKVYEPEVPDFTTLDNLR